MSFSFPCKVTKKRTTKQVRHRTISKFGTAVLYPVRERDQQEINRWKVKMKQVE